MEKIPVTFTHEGKEYKGTLSEVHGAAAKVWHLMIDNYYCGQLHFIKGKYVFLPNSKHGAWKGLGEEFGEVVKLWHE